MKILQPILSDMIYRGEGNSSLVIAIRSDAKVLRLLKKDGKIVKLGNDDHVRHHAEQTIKFIHCVMRPLSNEYFIHEPSLINLKSDVISRLNSLVKDLRPLHRMNKSLIYDDQDALVMQDYCSLSPKIVNYFRPYLIGPTLSVEIKPKQGFLPITHDSNRHSCLYGLAQYLKLVRGRIDRISQYCPLDLFSGCPVRMRHALKCLINTPQNNFRIFRDLTLVFGCDSTKSSTIFDGFFISPLHHNCNGKTNEDRFINLIVEALLRPFQSATKTDNQTEHTLAADSVTDIVRAQHDIDSTKDNSKYCQAHHEIMLDDCTKSKISGNEDSKCPVVCHHQLNANSILASVLRVQKLDTIGANSASRMLQWLTSHYDNPELALEALNAPVLPNNLGYPKRLPNETKLSYYHRKIWEFLVSLTAKDCSIMISMKKLEDTKMDLVQSSIENSHQCLHNHIITDYETGARYVFSLGITDLDQKSPFKISRMCENYERMLLSKRKFVEKLA